MKIGFLELLNTFINWITSHRRYKLVAVNPVTCGWIFQDTSVGQYCLVQSPQADPVSPLEMNDTEVEALLYSECLGWVPLDNNLFCRDLDALVKRANEQLVYHGATIRPIPAV